MPAWRPYRARCLMSRYSTMRERLSKTNGLAAGEPSHHGREVIGRWPSNHSIAARTSHSTRAFVSSVDRRGPGTKAVTSRVIEPFRTIRARQLTPSGISASEIAHFAPSIVMSNCIATPLFPTPRSHRSELRAGLAFRQGVKKRWLLPWRWRWPCPSRLTHWPEGRCLRTEVDNPQGRKAIGRSPTSRPIH